MSDTKRLPDAEPAVEAGPPSEEERDDAVIGVALRYSLVVLGLVGLLVGTAAAILYFQQEPPVVMQAAPPALPQVRAIPATKLPQIPFADVTESAGLDFVHENGAVGEKLLPETMGGGCAFLDYNGDGDADILLVNSQRWPWDTRPAPQTPATLALYKNDGTGRFDNVTQEAGLDASLYGQGCAVGDFDNDGDPDLFISAVTPRAQTVDGVIGGLTSPARRVDARQVDEVPSPGPHRLFRNDGGRFVDVTAEAGVSGRFGDWGTSCGWFDYDNDGDLDLWVCRYVEWSREFDLAQNFSLTGSDRAYGRPQVFNGMHSILYRNDGDGRFTDVSAEAGLHIDSETTGRPLAKSLGLTFADFDDDGRLDVIVANDTVRNFLFHNRGDGTFEEYGHASGLGYDLDGNARGAMGIDAACARQGDDCYAVAIGNFSNEMTAFYVSLPGTLQFTDEAVANGLGPSTRLQLTFGVMFLDADLDGRLDLFQANGHLEEDIAKVQASQTYEQSPQLFWNAGADRETEFLPLTANELGDDFVRPLVGRGSAYADIDGDGDLDILIAAGGQAPRLLRNNQQLGRHWLRLKLEGNGTTSNRDAVGARVMLHLSDGSVQHRSISATKSYLSQSELIATFGLADRKTVERVEIRWPDGARGEFGPLAPDRLHILRQP